MRRLRTALILVAAVCAVAAAAPSAIADTGPPISSSVNPSIVGQNVTFAVTIPVGVASYEIFQIDYVQGSGSPDMQSHAVPVDPGTGRAVFTVALTGIGTHSVDAYYGLTNGVARSPTLIQTVDPAPTDSTATRLTVAPGSAVLGSDVTALATVTDAANPGVVPAGDVTFESDGAAVGDAFLDPAGHASIDLNNLSLGGHSIEAVYAGQPATQTTTGWLGSTSAPAGETITAVPDPTQTSLSATLHPVRSGQALTLVAQVTDANSASTVPKGQVAFVDNGRSVATGTVTTLGFARATVRLSGRGDHVVVAEYRPASAWVASASEQFDVLVLAPNKVSTPKACTRRLTTLPLHIARGSHVSWVAYLIDGGQRAVSHRAPTFTVKVDVSALRAGHHKVTAVLHYASKGRNHPIKSLTGHFRVC